MAGASHVLPSSAGSRSSCWLPPIGSGTAMAAERETLGEGETLADACLDAPRLRDGEGLVEREAALV